MNTDSHELNFEELVGFIRQVHEELAAQAGRAVNLSLTLRNWLIGFGRHCLPNYNQHRRYHHNLTCGLQ